jgi:AcrR family transcriptional regulator/DNA-binding MarR family transcriptional regulator
MTDHRDRLMEAMVWVSATHGYAAASVERVSVRAGKSRRTFYEHFDNREACFIAALEHGFELLHDALAACCAERNTSAERLRAAAWEAICLIEDEPALTRMCVVEALAAGPAALDARRQGLDRLAAMIQDFSGVEHPGFARALLSAGLDRLHDALTSPAARIDPEELYREVAYPCLILIFGAEKAGTLTLAPPPARSSTPRARIIQASPSEPRDRTGERLTPRLLRTLAFLAAHPGAGNTELQGELGITYASQVSRYLHRLHQKGLVTLGEHRGRRRSWSLSAAGHELYESASAGAGAGR